ncbi:MAG: serine hydrolase domain-containing protein [Bacteroidales bacterium]
MIINDSQDSLKDYSQSANFKQKSHESLSNFKQKTKVQGLAFAIFNKNETLFSECLGNSTYGFKIDDKTLFSIQSISKNITTLAIMIAVQNGLLNLDSTVTKYLPSFTVNSCFEGSPEQKITLRMLLSHTAGFTHEAPIGNNYDYTPCDTKDHINSISETWLKFPVGTNYSYSNLGFDLASAIIAQKSGESFSDYLKSRIFLPLSMTNTTADDKEVVLNKNRTEGNISAVKKKHYPIPLPGSGAVYTSLIDFIKYAQLLMNYGETTNKTLIDKKYLYEMYKINIQNYGLGTYIDKSNDILYINHNGGGFGYSATLLWFPEYDLGAVILCNRPCNTFDICLSIMSECIKTTGLLKNSNITAVFDNINGYYFKNKIAIDRQKVFSYKCDSIFKPEWQKYVGKYKVIVKGMELKWYAKIAHFFGFGYQRIKIMKEAQSLVMVGDFGESTLKEFEPGLFFTKDYEALDLRTDSPIFKNILIQKK